MSYRTMALIATLLIVVRQVVAMLHGTAHEQLGVGLSPSQQVFVITIIGIVPWIALVLYWTRYRQMGALILWTSMLVGMLFGIYYHFIEVSTDHISHLPEGDGQGFFVATAIMLVPSELAAIAFGFWSWKQLVTTREG